jgi:hypothetical protein
MRLTNALLSGVAALALSTGAALAGGDSMSEGSMSQDLMPQESDAQPMDSQEREYTTLPHEYEVYDVYIIPADEVVLIPFSPSEVPISGSELG